jgi:hypothetical protein
MLRVARQEASQDTSYIRFKGMGEVKGILVKGPISEEAGSR